MAVLLCTPKVLQLINCTSKLSVKDFAVPRDGKVNVPCPHSIHRWCSFLSFTSIQMASCESVGNPEQPTIRSWCCRRKIIPGKSVSSHNFLESTTHVSRDQSRVLNSTRFGNEERTRVENIDSVELAEELETLETGSLLDISRDVAGFCALAEEGWGDFGRCARRGRERADGEGLRGEGAQRCSGNRSAYSLHFGLCRRFTPGRRSRSKVLRGWGI